MWIYWSITEKRFLPLPSVLQIRREDYWSKDNNKLKSCIFTLHFKSRLATQFSKRNIYFWQVDVLWISENHKFILLRVFYLILWKIYSTWKDIIIWINPSRRHSYFFFFLLNTIKIVHGTAKYTGTSNLRKNQVTATAHSKHNFSCALEPWRNSSTIRTKILLIQAKSSWKSCARPSQCEGGHIHVMVNTGASLSSWNKEVHALLRGCTSPVALSQCKTDP